MTNVEHTEPENFTYLTTLSVTGFHTFLAGLAFLLVHLTENRAHYDIICISGALHSMWNVYNYIYTGTYFFKLAKIQDIYRLLHNLS